MRAVDRVPTSACRQAHAVGSVPPSAYPQARAVEHQRLNGPKPKEQFLAVLQKGKKPVAEREPTEKEKKYASLPKAGPRPNGVSSSFRAKLGNTQSDENVVLKG